MVRNGLLQGIVLKDDISNFCVPCQKVKSTRGTFGQETLRGSSALDLVVSDVAGAVQESAAGNKYYVSIGDDWSGLTLVKAMAAKSMVDGAADPDWMDLRMSTEGPRNEVPGISGPSAKNSGEPGSRNAKFGVLTLTGYSPGNRNIPCTLMRKPESTSVTQVKKYGTRNVWPNWLISPKSPGKKFRGFPGDFGGHVMQSLIWGLTE
ncbi:hypothetical protein A4X13_0g8352 [Tilletia indica]|uniref:Uncharacterized protein n=1 Tax=Tilletia indica TaxID=43049 RepID=A0A177TFG8_9BASI|nr:hypothetical protein A4X13_0g8352 [Tilletia indica]